MHRQFGIIGKSLCHSFSREYFTQKFEKEYIHNASYDLFPLETLDAFIPFIQKNTDIIGLNVTIPYKEKIIAYVHFLDEIAKRVEAVNVLKIQRTYDTIRIYGYNTDAIGFESILLQYNYKKHASALILGTGGAAKAVAFVLETLHIPYTFVSRTHKKNAILYTDIDVDLIKKNTLIINCTPLGMFPCEETYPFLPYEAIGKVHLLIDLVYNPPESIFLKKGKRQGASIQNGYEMLCRQAEASWKIWNN